ncbi:MAG: orotidine-5'-phosphate decarboxylase [Candidatus Aminicenantes bacterium]
MAENNAEKIIVALDVDTRQKALELVRRLPSARCYKIGLRLYTAEGPGFIQEIAQMGKRIFLDLKFHDIPNTVAGAVKAAVDLGVDMMTLHASGGVEMMARAVEEAAEETAKKNMKRPHLLAVTILTSLQDSDLKKMNIPSSPMDMVLTLASLAQEAGMDGIVCSPKETPAVRKQAGPGFKIVTPGIRPAWASAGDQKRILTPAEAVRSGSDYLVVGRPVIQAASPEEALEQIIQELDVKKPGNQRRQ